MQYLRNATRHYTIHTVTNYRFRQCALQPYTQTYTVIHTQTERHTTHGQLIRREDVIYSISQVYSK